MKDVKTKKIKSKKEKRAIIYDILFIVLCLIVFDLKTGVLKNKITIIGGYIEYLNFFNGNFIDMLNISIVYIWMILIGVITHCFLLIVVYLAFRIARLKVIKENSKFRVIDNIDYYRERFNNITPAEISLITDLEIESKKDIVASILDLYQRKILDFSENRIIINDELPMLRRSENKIIEMVKNRSFDSKNIKEWENFCLDEAKKDNFISPKEDKQKGPNFKQNSKLISISVALFFISILIGGVYLASPAGQKWYSQIEEYEKYDKDNISDIEIANSSEEAKALYTSVIKSAGPMIIVSLILLGPIFILIGTPIYRFVRKKIYKKIEINNRFVRTKEGDILVEQIAGIKNFIHDFSILSERDKESIILWEDFLIYAVLLEENETIIKNILKYKNFNLDIWQRIINYK